MLSASTAKIKPLSSPHNTCDHPSSCENGQHHDHSSLRAARQPCPDEWRAEHDPSAAFRASDTTPLEEDHNGSDEIGQMNHVSDSSPAQALMTSASPEDKSRPVPVLPTEIWIHAISHLSPNDLATVSLVSRYFHRLVATPHAWQAAFTRYFPGSLSLQHTASRAAWEERGVVVISEKRRFTRLTALTSWRGEYILRTKLLRSLARGRPAQVSSPSFRNGHMQAIPPVTTYNVRTFGIVNHLHGTFGSGLDRRMPRFVHGADDVGIVTSSDPTTGKIGPWGQSDPHFYSQFSERFPGMAEWGLGAGDITGCPNVMDVSQPYGVIYGQGCPEGSCYYRSSEEMRGRFIAETTNFSLPERGIPDVGIEGGAICCVWIAKSNAIPLLSEGLVGMMMGSAIGVVTACSIGTDGLRGARFSRGELTARWVLSPGVPIIAIAVDEHYTLRRQAQNRIWAVALNALGELFYLTKFPSHNKTKKIDTDFPTECLAWLTGRSVYWSLVEPSRRTARSDPYNDAEVDGSYSPRMSSDNMCLSKEQIIAETREIQQYLSTKPKHFQKFCLGWDMRRRLEVDFAGDDGNFAGEAIIVFDCGLKDDDKADAKRFTRWRTVEKGGNSDVCTRTSVFQPPQISSLHGSVGPDSTEITEPSPRIRGSSYTSGSSSPERAVFVEEWRRSQLTFGSFVTIQVTATALDISTFATLTTSEDPALGFSTSSSASSPFASPTSVASQPSSPSDIPGQRARFVAAGTNNGIVILWDIRSSAARSAEYTNRVNPIRIIYTDSPKISCMALTSLHIVVGGNDGLVQAWDPLASSTSPIRTLNSRHSSRARRRLIQAQASIQGIGINMFAAGAISLDPDPTVLRGAVSLGNQIRYWNYSSAAADQYKSTKRRLRRSERCSNSAGDRSSGTFRTNLKGYIVSEKLELEREKWERRQEAQHRAGRFGTELLSEEEALAYAAMLSQEAMEADEKRRRKSGNSALSFGQPSSSMLDEDEDDDADIAEAIRLSLHDSPESAVSASALSPSDAFGVSIKYAKNKKALPPKSESVDWSMNNELSDLEFAMQISLAEEASRNEAEGGFSFLHPDSSGQRGGGEGT